MAKSFLLTDDDIDDRELFAEALVAIDPSITCHFAEDGEAAIRLLTDKQIEKPDIIFLDINMPVMDGWQVLRKLKSDNHYEDVPVMMYSTSSASGDRKTAKDLGALCFVTKPYNYKLVKSMLELVITNLNNNSLSTVCNEIQALLKNTG